MTDLNRLRRGYDAAAKCLLSEAGPYGTWEGELSSSPLSTATAIAALQLVQRTNPARAAEFAPLIQGGLQWLAQCQNPDGGWGDTIKSHSNISTATLVYASFHLVKSDAIAALAPSAAGSPCFAASGSCDDVMLRAKGYLDDHGGFDAIRRRYGKDHTFSVPILTQCALAGLLPWDQLTPLPFELGWLPHWFYRWVHLPVVSYALPALIAIGQVRHYHQPSRNPLLRWIRQASVKPTLRRLESIQPESGGFLEATPLTSFVTMSLAAMGLNEHPVARKGIEFLQASVRPDGSWPIDTNLATWVTTLSVNALRPESITSFKAEAITDWLLHQQHRVVHRYTNAAPGGWAWTDLSGGVPDADDTPGAILALLKLNSANPNLPSALLAGINWLLDLQNRDGGWPTFCRGWGALPFDRSTPDLTAHALRALRGWLTFHERHASDHSSIEPHLLHRVNMAVKRGFSFLDRTQHSNGTWFPLWFGNQFSADEENPVYGVARVLAAYRDWNRLHDQSAQHAIKWLASVQNPDGGWGGAAETPSSTEETALAAEILLAQPEFSVPASRGLDWLLERVESKMFQVPAPIGLYFAKLWYFERLYPIIFTVSAFARAIEQADPANSLLK
ncbi:prenyltransferase/squalene oxidase repeat-containing protein [Schlesneria paludicola]|uniref:prenyltransferase/squalene oxidase repeat-containing protein n=1 Tax=Schlesneria paludicola TaxID=360056 RepID=UPI00029B3A81|nr:prenyltransferase/squalene oxidase repeat-containing protein [Schlesneria paludicola]